jgi:hypothetical protein
MAKVTSRAELLAEIDAEHAEVLALIDATPRPLWRDSSVNTAGWNLKDVLAHVADWGERCDGWCELGDSLSKMTPPGEGFKWNETRELNHEIYLARRGHSLERVLKEFSAAHAALRHRAATMDEAELLTVGRFGWCGKAWSVAKHIRAATAAHDRWASKHFSRVLRDAGVAGRAKMVSTKSSTKAPTKARKKA